MIRYLTDPDYRAVKRWKWAKGDDVLRYSVPIPSGGVILDVGAYIGDFAQGMAERTQGIIHAFEPVEAFAAQCRVRVQRFPQIHVHAYGLSNRDETARISLDGLGSSQYRAADNSVEAKFRDIVPVLQELNIDTIALAKLNIEGGEYDVLPRLIEAGLMERVSALMVQFHRTHADAEDRYDAIATALAKTHALQWRYPFIWELWLRKAGQ
ncbi:MAG TPA: hypothetical protein DCL54_13945 [Alphaproteobacteria bacterium]|nr:hypothetical protein [Alphaproteobacteria bacterium]